MLRTNDRRAVGDPTPPFDRAVKEQDAFRRASAFVCWLTDVKALPWQKEKNSEFAGKIQINDCCPSVFLIIML